MTSDHKRLLSITALALATLAAALVPATRGFSANLQPPNPLALYGKEARYLVLRDGQVVGRNIMNFSQRGDSIEVAARMELELRFLALKIYSYLYESRETWTGAQLERLLVKVDDDGEQSKLSGERRGAKFVFEGHGGAGNVEGLIFPTNHWNAAVLSERRVLNTLTGSINDVEITVHGREKVRANGGEIEATRYSYNGDLQTEVWYDDAGRWVGMRFRAKDGSTIVYQCEVCWPESSS